MDQARSVDWRCDRDGSYRNTEYRFIREFLLFLHSVGPGSDRCYPATLGPPRRSLIRLVIDFRCSAHPSSRGSSFGVGHGVAQHTRPDRRIQKQRAIGSVTTGASRYHAVMCEVHRGDRTRQSAATPFKEKKFLRRIPAAGSLVAASAAIAISSRDYSTRTQTSPHQALAYSSSQEQCVRQSRHQSREESEAGVPTGFSVAVTAALRSAGVRHPEQRCGRSLAFPCRYHRRNSVHPRLPRRWYHPCCPRSAETI